MTSIGVLINKKVSSDQIVGQISAFHILEAAHFDHMYMPFGPAIAGVRIM